MPNDDLARMKLKNIRRWVERWNAIKRVYRLGGMSADDYNDRAVQHLNAIAAIAEYQTTKGETGEDSSISS